MPTFSLASSIHLQGQLEAAVQKYNKAVRYLAPDSFDVDEEASTEDAQRMAAATVPALLNRC